MKRCRHPRWARIFHANGRRQCSCGAELAWDDPTPIPEPAS